MKIVPRKYRKLYEKRLTSRKAAIRYFCLECVGFDMNEVKNCTDKDCSLYKWRLTG